MFKFLQSSAILSAGLMASSMAFAAIDGAYTEDFEGCVITDLNAIGNITNTPVPPQTTCATTPGFIGFVSVFDAANVFQYDYGGVFPAPNNGSDTGASISGLAVNEGGANQGNNQLNFFSDYNNGDHFNASGFQIEVSIFKEWTIDMSDLDKTHVFRFSYKTGNITGSTTANAFIKTIGLWPALSFPATNVVTADTNNGAGSWVEDIEISLFLDSSVDDVDNTTGALGADGIPDLVGQVFQIGFDNKASGGTDSGMFYDNLSLFVGGACVGNGTDTDGDGIDDNCDNCINVANAAQIDADSDGHGNFCDADFNNDCAVGFPDLTTFSNAFFTTDPLVDLNGDGSVGFPDLTIFSNSFFGVPGPSGVDIVPAPACNP